MVSCIRWNNTVACGTGEYSILGDKFCHACPAGFSCDGFGPKACPEGEYSDEWVLTCSPCPVGYSCLDPF